MFQLSWGSLYGKVLRRPVRARPCKAPVSKGAKAWKLGLGFRVWGLGFRVWGLGFKV